MNLHLLRMFMAVVEHAGFSRAAEALHVSQPAVSKAVRELEHQLGLPLLERGGMRGRGITLTDHGQSLHQHARAIFAMERAAIADIRDRVDLRKGTLRVGASTTLAGYWLPPHVATFVQRFAQIDFGLRVGNTAEIGHAIAEGRIDVAFVEGVVDDPGIVATRWRDEPLQLVVAADAKLGAKRRASIAELARQPWLLREAGSGTRQVAQRLLRARGIKPLRLLELGSNEAIARAVAAGAGVALLPAIVVQDLVEMRRIRVVRMADDAGIVRPLFRLELANRPRAPALQAFIDLVDAAGA
jgi:LysR family transcriptional regulator, transcriptional activator of the cysJI operon